MMTTLFKTVIEGMINNNEINDAQFSDWDMAQDAINLYAEQSQIDECSEEELTATLSAIDNIIRTNGEALQQEIQDMNIMIWGQDFIHNGESVPFCG